MLKNVGFLAGILIVMSLIPKQHHSGPEVKFEYSRKRTDFSLFDIEEKNRLAEIRDKGQQIIDTLEENQDQVIDPFADLDGEVLTQALDSTVEAFDVFGEQQQSTSTLIASDTKPIEPEKRVIDAAVVASFDALDQNSSLSDSQYLREFNKIYYETKVKGVKPASRTDVVIRYYKKELDGDNVYALQQSGFYIHERTSKEKVLQYATNAIFYGSDVSLEDVKMVAFMLLRKGIKIQEIAPYTTSNDWKARSIELATDITKLDSPAYNLADIRNLRF